LFEKETIIRRTIPKQGHLIVYLIVR